MDKPIPEAVRDMPVADALDVVNAAANDARHAGDYAKANALVIARRTLYRAALIAAQQQGQQGQANFPPSEYVGATAKVRDCNCQRYDGRDCRKCFNPPYPDEQPTQQGGGDDLVEAEGEVYARKDVEPEILHEFRPFTAPQSAPVGVEGLARRIESYHWDVADKPVAAKFAAELRSLAQQPDADPLEEWANRPLNFTATVGKFEDGAVVQQPAAVDGAMVERIAALLYEEATDEPWTVAGVEHPGPDRGYYRGLASKVAAISAQQPAGRPPKPTECMNGCPDRQVCDHCQWPPGPDQQSAAVDGVKVPRALVKDLLAALQGHRGDLHFRLATLAAQHQRPKS